MIIQIGYNRFKSVKSNRRNRNVFKLQRRGTWRKGRTNYVRIPHVFGARVTRVLGHPMKPRPADDFLDSLSDVTALDTSLPTFIFEEGYLYIPEIASIDVE